MAITRKAIAYKKCLMLTSKREEYKLIYKMLYKTSSLNFWLNEYRFLISRHIHMTEQIKIILDNKVPIELYFKIMSYLPRISI